MSFYECIKTILTICKFLFFREAFDLAMSCNKIKKKDMVSFVYLWCCTSIVLTERLKSPSLNMQNSCVHGPEQTVGGWPHCEWHSLTRWSQEIFFNWKYSVILRVSIYDRSSWSSLFPSAIKSLPVVLHFTGYSSLSYFFWIYLSL